jgi:excinuclease UvrABC ATPase subunit
MKKGDTMARMYFESIGKHYGVDIKNKPIKKLPRNFLEKILYGTGSEEIDFEYESSVGTRKFTRTF